MCVCVCVCARKRRACAAPRGESCLKCIGRSEGRGNDPVVNRRLLIHSKEDDDDEGHELSNNGCYMYK